MPSRRVVRSREQAIGIAVVGVVGPILGLAEALSRPEVGAPRTVASVISAVAWGAFCILRAARAGAYVTPAAMTETIAARRKNIQAGMERFGVAKLRRFPHEKQLATDNVQLEDILGFRRCWSPSIAVTI
jgi:hypothetical protein